MPAESDHLLRPGEFVGIRIGKNRSIDVYPSFRGLARNLSKYKIQNLTGKVRSKKEQKSIIDNIVFVRMDQVESAINQEKVLRSRVDRVHKKLAKYEKTKAILKGKNKLIAELQAELKALKKGAK